jgi:hypothetical protein
MRNVSDKSFSEKQNAYFVFNNFFPENRAFWGIMWKNVVEADWPKYKMEHDHHILDI